MKRKNKKRIKLNVNRGILLLPIIFLFCSIFARADWPVFLGNNSRTSNSRQWLYQPEKIWEYDMGNPAAASPVISDGIVITADRAGNIYAFDLESGDLRGIESLGYDIKSTPVLDMGSGSGFVFTLPGKLFELDTGGGSIKNIYDLDAGSPSSPLVLENDIYLGRGWPENDILRICRKTESIKNVFHVGQPVWSSPLYHNGRIYAAANDGNVYEFDRKLNKLRVFSTDTGIFRTSSLSASGGILYFAPGDTLREIYSLNTSGFTSSKSVPLNTGGDGVYTSSVALGEDGNVYVVISSTVQVLYSLDAKTLELNWKRELAESRDKSFQPTPVYTDGIVYSGTEQGYLKGFYTSDNPAAGIESGDTALDFDISGSTNSMILSPAVSDGYLAVVTDSGKAALFKSKGAAAITGPATGGVLSGKGNSIKGTARADDFEKYDLLYAADSSPSNWSLITSSQVKVNSSDLGKWDVSNLKDGLYTLKLRVEGGNQTGRAFRDVVVDNPPLPPFDLKAETVQGGGVMLSWSKSPDDGDGNNDVEGYNIYRAEKATSAFNFNAPLDSVTFGRDLFIDSEAEPFTTYYYLIRSFDSLSESKNSEIVSGYIDESFVWFDIPAEEGGWVRLPGGSGIFFPAGALEKDAKVKMQPLGTESIPRAPALTSWLPSSLAWSISIDPVQKFSKPVRLELSYGNGNISHLQEELLRVYWYDVQDDIWRMVNTSEVNIPAGQVNALVERFSYFRIGQHLSRGNIINKENVYTYPNPASGSEAVFKFLLEKAADIKIEIFNVAGDPVGRIRRSYETADAGKWQEIEWDISSIASGVYIYRIQASSGSREDEVIKRTAVIK